MKMHYSHRLSTSRIAQIVGAFVMVPLLGLIVVGIFMAKSEHLFEEKYLLRTSLSKSYGLEPGAPVLVSGIPIGRVEAVEFNDRGTIDVTLQLRRRYQEMVREDSELSIVKSGLVMGQTQVLIAMGNPKRPVLADGEHIKTVEPRDYAELLEEIKPMLESVRRTLQSLEEITKDVHIAVQTGGRVLTNVEHTTQELPSVVVSVQRTVGSVERTAADLPEITESIKKTLATVDGIAFDVRTATAKLPGVMTAAQDAVNNVKVTTENIKVMSKDIPPMVQTANTTLNDVNTIIRGAKKTFPISAMVKNAGPESSSRTGNGLRSLRGDQLSQ
jgi:phospholipid/cholesterol/gamma-HCH transport system substrate-binding protein